MGRASPLFLVLLGLGIFFATYNLVTLVIHHQRREQRAELPGVDPVTRMPDELRRAEGSRRPFHVVVTATDAAYSRWQCRVMYYWYKRMKDGEGSEMGGFTRVLHSGKPDSLMDEIPTFVVNPLPAGMDRGELTYGKIGEWRFDKRSFLLGPPPRNLSLPPPGVPESVVCISSRLS
ncbi:hypothetical protein BHE74_00015576 [Ensete ventricosum]|nr:hypothetical protein BHE74_00015576 [Ensete ventricosum]RZR78357.1 hypothetical protein BHM03_00003641 [Ensete ventricosum]